MQREADLELIDEANAAVDDKKNGNLTEAEIKLLTDMVVQKGMLQVDAVAVWNKEHHGQSRKTVSATTLSRYVNHFVQNKTYFVPAKRGPKGLLSDAEKNYLLDLTVVMRRLGWQLCSKRFRALARGVARKHRGDGGVEPVPGLSVFSESWARDFMTANGFKVRAQTTTRVVELADVIKEGNIWFEALPQRSGKAEENRGATEGVRRHSDLLQATEA